MAFSADLTAEDVMELS